MRKMSVIIAGLALFASLYATTGISGVVTDYESGNPIYHATISGSGLHRVHRFQRCVLHIC